MTEVIEDKRTKCPRCLKYINIDVEELGVEILSEIRHRFYHWKCVVKDKTFAQKLEHKNVPK